MTSIILISIKCTTAWHFLPTLHSLWNPLTINFWHINSKITLPLGRVWLINQYVWLKWMEQHKAVHNCWVDPVLTSSESRPQSSSKHTRRADWWNGSLMPISYKSRNNGQSESGIEFRKTVKRGYFLKFISKEWW